MIHFSLFSGIGGFDIAARDVGWKNYLSCEINPFCNQVLSYHFPEAYHHTDIKNLTYGTVVYELSKRFGKNWRNEDIVLSGGFPCQPYSLAGKRKGTEDERHLWPNMLGTIRQIRPKWVVGENVFGIVNWSGGLVFEQVQTDLENEGYQVQSFILPACGVNAPHRRDRVWFVAYTDNKRRHTRFGEVSTEDGEIPQWHKDTKSCYSNKFTSSNPIRIRTQFNKTGIFRNKKRYNKVEVLRNKKFTGRIRNFSTTGIFTYSGSKRRNNGCNNWKERRFQGNERTAKKNKPEWNGWKRRSWSVSTVATNSTHKYDWRSFRKPIKRQKQQFGKCIEQNVNPYAKRQRLQRWLRKEKSRTTTFQSASFYSPRTGNWKDFPTQPPVRFGNDGISCELFRLLTQELLDEINKTPKGNRVKNLPEMWERISQEEVWQQIRGFYSLESKEILLQTMQLYSEDFRGQINLSPFSKSFCRSILWHLREYGEFRCTSQGQELEKQRARELGNALSLLPHEVALAARRFEIEFKKFKGWHRQEAIKALGNAIVPQVAMQIFRSIQEYENNYSTKYP